MKRVNLHRAALSVDGDEPPGYGSRYAQIGGGIGGEHLGGTLFELEPGQHAGPYHWEAALEEWLWVLEGSPSVRTPEGERRLRPGDIVCFPVGPAGAHKVTNAGQERARIVMLSNRAIPNAIVYPDSDKVAVCLTADAPSLHFLRSAAVDYWHGEPS